MGLSREAPGPAAFAARMWLAPPGRRDLGAVVVGLAVTSVDSRGCTRFGIFGAMGGGTPGGELAASTVAAHRRASLAGTPLVQTAEAIHTAVAQNRTAFISGVIGELDTVSGRLTWTSAGHPDPLLLQRLGRPARCLASETAQPFGLNRGFGSVPWTLAREDLEVGDRVVVYVDSPRHAARRDMHPSASPSLATATGSATLEQESVPLLAVTWSGPRTVPRRFADATHSSKA